MTIRALAVWLVLALGLSACGGSSGGSDKAVQGATLTGLFVDAPVQGLRYTTTTQSGFTGADGGFRYVVGETVEFFVGDIRLGGAVVLCTTINGTNNQGACRMF